MASVDTLTISSPPRPFRSFSISPSPVLPSPTELVQKDQSLLRTEGRPNSVSHDAESLSKPPSATLFTIDRPNIDLNVPLELGSNMNGIVRNEGITHTNRSSIMESDSVQEVANLAGTKVKKASGHDDISTDGAVAPKPRQRKVACEPTDLAVEVEKKARKPRSKKADNPAGANVVKEKAPRKPRSTKTDKPAAEDEPKAKAPRKPRAKKTQGDVQTKMPQLQVTKSSTSSKSKLDINVAKPERSEAISRHFSTVDSSTAPQHSLSNGLLEAVKRRTCWTPPKPTVETTGVVTQIPDAADDIDDLVELANSEENSKGFSDLFGKFAFSSMQAPVSRRTSSDESGMKKRKLIEMLPTSGFILETATAVPKIKAPKKKARTITGQAISAYSHEEGSSTPPLLQYFSSKTANSGTNDGFKVPSKPHSKNVAKTSSKRGEGTAQVPILLSPESAMKEVGNQDFLFGTSSQLAREESPTFLRDMHAAMQASNEVEDNDPFTDPFHTSITPIHNGESPVTLTKRNLWSAAARDTGGKLLDIQMVDLSDSPTTTSVDVGTFIDTAPIAPVSPKTDSIWHEIEDFLDDDVVTNRKESLTTPSKLPLPLEPPNLVLAKSRGPELSSRVSSMPQSTDTISLNKSAPTNKMSTAECDPDKPDFSSYTNAELAKKIASYRLKPLKNRDHMIILLERCWEGKKRMALHSLQANAMLQSSSNLVTKPPSDQPENLSPKRARGRPRTTTGLSQNVKAKKTIPGTTSTIGQSEPNDGAAQSKAVVLKKTQNNSKIIVDEISDSDASLTPSPPRRRPSQIRSSPLPLKIASSTAVDESPATTPELSQTRLFKYITRAVTNVPRSKDPTNPSWHEKILLYDPIILEDLAMWLNTGALEKAGWDGEVHPAEVKKWCISKSICCLWRENMRGGVRARF